MKTLTATLTAALIATGTAVVLPAEPADAQASQALRQRRAQQQQQQQPGQIGQLSREESAAIMPLYEAAQAQNWEAAQAAMAAAQAGAQSAYARYVVAQLQLQLGRGTNDTSLQAQAVDAMVASGAAPADVLPQLLSAQSSFAIQARNFAVAESALSRLLELSPDDVERIEQLALVKVQLQKRPEALQLYQRAVQLREASGQAVPEDSYRRMLAMAYEARQAPQALELSKTLLTNYPTPTNWRDALIIYRELGNPDPTLNLDLYRLMSATGALTSERDYVEYAEAAQQGAIFGEVKSALEQGLASNAITGNAAYAREMLTSANRRVDEDRGSLPTEKTRALSGSSGQTALRVADAFYGYGNYADAAELYRAALQKGGVDANLVNTRLGATLARAGQRAEAEAALRTVTGPRAELANFWLLWLSRRG